MSESCTAAPMRCRPNLGLSSPLSHESGEAPSTAEGAPSRAPSAAEGAPPGAPSAPSARDGAPSGEAPPPPSPSAVASAVVSAIESAPSPSKSGEPLPVARPAADGAGAPPGIGFRRVGK